MLARMSALVGGSGLTLEVDSADRFDVREFTVDEGLSSLFSVELVAVSENPAIDLEETVGADATFSLDAPADLYQDAAPPRWSGIISEVHQLRSEDSGLSTYHLTLVPRLWLLTHRVNCRVFQQMTDLDVALAILGEWGLEPKVETSRAYKTRKMRVQYQETDHAFVSRLFEASGVTYLFRRSEEGSILVLADAPETGPRRTSALEHSNQPMGVSLSATGFRASRAIRSGRVTIADHDHRIANAPLLGQAKSGSHAIEDKLEHFSYAAGAFRFGKSGPKDTPSADDRGRTRTDPDEATRIAEQTAAAKVARSKRFGFETNALDLSAGMILDVSNHPMAEREGSLLLTRVTLSGTHDSETSVACRAASAAAPYRPEAETPSPSIFGVESATVVGPSGETIHTDEFGRVRVQFHWDRYGTMDEYSSCWVPVTQAWAGDALGSLNLPRIGQEVIVSFLGGSPEEPVIVGRIFTNLLRPPFPMPQNKTQSGFRSASVPQTGGYNELMFEDKASAELLRMRAEKDMRTRVNNDQASSVGNDRSDHVERHDRETVDGDQRHAVGGEKSTTVGKDQITKILGSLLGITGGDQLLKTVGAFVSHALSHQITSDNGTTITVGASTIHIGPDAIIIQSPKVLLNPGDDVASNASLGGATPTH
jgi:type VI secretion system secreted protein VgrG